MRYFKKSLEHFQPDDLKAVDAFIRQIGQAFPISLFCNLFKVSRSAYYAYKTGESYQPKAEQITEREQVRDVFQVHKRRYGTRRLVAELQDMGMRIGRKKVRELLKTQELVAIHPRSFVPRTTDSRHGKRVAPNLFLEAAEPTGSDQIGAGDITYIPLAGGKWAYLATWLDLYSRMLIGWQLNNDMEENLIISAIQKGFQWRNPVPGLIVHSDRGGQYVGDESKKLLKKHDCQQSMSRAEMTNGVSRKVPVSKTSYVNEIFAKSALDFIDQHKKNPFYLYIAFTLPHAELKVQDRYLKPYLQPNSQSIFAPETAHPAGKHYGPQAYPKAAYAAMVTSVDDYVSSILKKLADSGLEENTIVFFSSDNGTHLEGGHTLKDATGFFKSSGPLRGVKRDLYEGGIRVPLIAYWKNTIKPNTTSNHVAAFWDIVPTFSVLAGGAAPAGTDGISFVPALLSRKNQPEH